jgi:hypothetical protein
MIRDQVNGRFAAVCAFLSLIMTPIGSFALDSTQISQVESAVVTHICSDPSWVACWNEQPTQCTSVIRSVTRKCLEEYLATAQTGMDQTKANEIGSKIIGCLNKEFVASHPMGKKNTPECSEVPQHLR